MRILKSINPEIGRGIGVGMLVFLAFATIIAAYGGMVNPDIFPAAALIAMTFPGLIVIDILVLVLLIVLRRRIAWVAAVVLVVCLPSLLNFAPLGIHGKLSPDEKQQSFTFMTFNTLHWEDYENTDPPIVPNPSLQYVIDTDPDILCVQESTPTGVRVNKGITPAQRDTIDRRYPYAIIDHLFPGLALYSKYPVTRVVLQDSICGTAVMAAYRVSIQGHLLTIYNLHLQSLLLTPEDKILYSDITRRGGGADKIVAVRDQIFSKLYNAFKFRAVQARYIRSLLDKRSGNTIVCGDFNDIPGCYAVRTIMGDDMRDAYADAAFGPAITYHKNRFYFRIDHILYRGAMRAIDMERGTDVISDHYPLTATFIWNNNE